VGFTVETPLVGTVYRDENESRITTNDWSLYDFQHAVLPTALPLDRFYREMVKLHLFGIRTSARAGATGSIPLRDQVRIAWTFATRLPDLWFGARHHSTALRRGGVPLPA
jgi:hypothetical protein